MWADILTKEKKMTSTFGEVIAKNNLSLGDTTINKVKAFSQEVWITNICNRSQSPALKKENLHKSGGCLLLCFPCLHC